MIFFLQSNLTRTLCLFFFALLIFSSCKKEERKVISRSIVSGPIPKKAVHSKLSSQNSKLMKSSNSSPANCKYIIHAIYGVLTGYEGWEFNYVLDYIQSDMIYVQDSEFSELSNAVMVASNKFEEYKIFAQSFGLVLQLQQNMTIKDGIGEYCDDPNEGGGSGGNGNGETPEDQAEMAALYAATEFTETSSELSVTAINKNDTERLYAYDWEVGINSLTNWSVVSHETGKHKRVGNEWHFKDVVHNNFSVNNKPSWIQVEVTENGQAISTIGTLVAGVSIKCNVKAWAIFKGMPIGAPSKDVSANSPALYSNIP